MPVAWTRVEANPGLTIKRILFRGPRQFRQCAYPKLTAMDHAPNGSWTAISVAIGRRPPASGTARRRRRSAMPDDLGPGRLPRRSPRPRRDARGRSPDPSGSCL